MSYIVPREHSLKINSKILSLFVPRESGVEVNIDVWTEENEEQKILNCIKSKCRGIDEDDKGSQPSDKANDLEYNIQR